MTDCWRWIVSIIAVAVFSTAALADPDANRLNNGRLLTPAGGVIQDVGSRPLNLAVTADGRYAITSGSGEVQQLWAIDTSTGKGASHIDFDRGRGAARSNGLYYGVAVSPANTIYAAQGANNSIAVAVLQPNGSMTVTGSIPCKEGDFPTGLALDGRGDLYVSNSDPDTWTKPSSVVIYDTTREAEIGRYEFDQSHGGTPNFPSALAVMKNGSKLYVASERDGCVYVLDTSAAGKPTLIKSVPTGSHPDALVFDKDELHLFVANAQSDTISVIETVTDTVQSTISLRPDKVEGPYTATPTGLALSTDNSKLYVSLADMNAVAVVDLTRKGGLAGFIPAGWNPTAVGTTGGKLMVVDSRGTLVRHPNPDFIDGARSHGVLSIIHGDVMTIDLPTAGQLAADTKTVIADNAVTTGTPLSPKSRHYLSDLGLPGGIQHIIYVIKENRTYDQVLGDLPDGNGDHTLTIFGNDVTPNQHEFAERYLLLDNFYDCGDVSGEGWPWSTQGVANSYVLKSVPYYYSGRGGRDYDFEGQNNGYPTGGLAPADPDGKPMSSRFPNGAPSIPDVAESAGGHLWDAVLAAKLTVRNYGCFLTFGSDDIPDNYPASKGLQPPGHNGAGVTDYDYRRFDLNYADSDAPKQAFEKTKNADCLYTETTYGLHSATSRIDEFRHEFLDLMAEDPFGDNFPALTLLRLGNDHTSGLRPGAHSPRSMVADNDFAVGELVYMVSHSYIWKSTVIFVVEDDAQDGADHVDCHRSTCYVISPFIKEHTHDGRFYNTDSVIHTIEAMLRIPPMTAYDASAPVIKDFQMSPDNADGYRALDEDPSIIAERNPSPNALAPGSTACKLANLAETLDFEHPDSAPAQAVNEMVWKSVRGMASTPPAPRHMSGLKLLKSDPD